MISKHCKILVIRRDLIGDLVCALPMAQVLRQHFPGATIDILVSSYCAPIIENAGIFDHIHSYVKNNSQDPVLKRIAKSMHRVPLLWALRRNRYDAVLLPKGRTKRDMRLVKFIAPKDIFSSTCVENVGGRHEVECVFDILMDLGMAGPPPPIQLRAASVDQDIVRNRISSCPWYDPHRMTVAIHISSRKPSQRWPAEYFCKLMEHLYQSYSCQFVLLWSPGKEDNPAHPGDDKKATAIKTATHVLPIVAYPTNTLPELVAALSLCHMLICSDGGAMHIGAGLGLPIVCLFGDSMARQWHPWGVPYELLQKPTRKASDITPEEVVQSFSSLCRRLNLSDEKYRCGVVSTDLIPK